jgi:enhancer of mRNA-decapping protein 3
VTRPQHISATSQQSTSDLQAQYRPKNGIDASKIVPPAPIRETTQQPFVDPAILSFSKPPRTAPEVLSTELVASNSVAASTAVDVATVALDIETTPRELQRQDSAVTAILTEPFNQISLDGKSQILEIPRPPSTATTQPNVPQEFPVKQTAERSRHESRKNHHENNGWRTSDFVAPTQPRKGRANYGDNYPGTQSRTSRRLRYQKNYAENPNGWATEDATDIQEMGDFDFQGNLSKFDKRKVFDEIRNDDNTADEDRLVSHNRRAARPGTNGGKNLHYTENVLDSPPPVWNSEAGETDTDVNGDLINSGNYSSRERSKTVPKVQSRNGSGATIQPQHKIRTPSHTRAQFGGSRTASPKPSIAPPSVNATITAHSGSLRLSTTNRSCPTITPLQMLEVEQLAVTELGLSEEIIIENSGRGIAEGVVNQLTSDSAAPTVLVLTANHRTAARAVCAARHLRNRGHRVTACVVGHDDNALLDNCRKQLEIFKKIGGRVLRWEELSARLATADFTPDFVVDAILGIHLAFEDFRTDDQASVFEILAWINRSKLDVLSVDVPSGVSALTGMYSSIRCDINRKWLT